MKKTINILLLFAVLAMLLATVSCGTQNSDVSSEALQESSDEPLPPVVYTVVYNKLYGEEALALAEAVKKASGLEFECVVYERDMVIPDNSFVIGHISDGVAGTLENGLARRDFLIKKVDSTIYCVANSNAAITEAVTYVIDSLVSERGIELEDGYEYLYDFPYPLEEATVNGVLLKSFDLVFASTNDEAKYKDVADDFKAYLQSNANATVRVLGEAKEESGKEIIIGIASGRELVSGESAEAYDYNEYKITVSGDRVAIVGANACAVWHGCMAFAEALENSGGNLTDCVINGTCTLIKVSCVGDSITEGVNSSDIYSQTYPVYLQRMLGFDYLVKNHGHSGYSVVFTDPYSYSKSYRFTQVKRFVPDVVIYMLGTNDCNPAQDYKSWEDGSREIQYREDTLKYLDTFRALNEDVQIFMCIPPTLCYSTVWPWFDWAAGIEAHTAIINREIAEQEGLPVVDMFSWSKEHPEVFPDGLHPLNETYKTYAKRVYDEIIDTIITVK